MQRLRELSRKVMGPGGLEGMLQDVIDAAVATVGADRGTVQLLDRESPRIVAHHGFKTPFLKFFQSPGTVASSSAHAARRGERVVVPDVEKSKLFAGTELLAVLQAAGVRSVQSTPIVSRSGKVVGTLNTHWKKPHRPDEHELSLIDLLVRQAADLIEVEQAGAAMREQAALLNLAHDAIMVRDLRGRITFWSNGAQETYGWTREEALGKVAHRLLKIRFPKPLAELNAEVAEIGQWDGELTHTRKDGCEIVVISRWAAQWRSDGKQIGVLEINRDITQRKRAEEALRASELTLRTFYESAPLMLGVVEVPADNSDIIHCYDNAATDRFFGRPRGSTAGQSALQIGAPEAAVRTWIENYRRAEREGKAVQFEYLHPHESGALWLSAVVAKIGPGNSGRTRFSYAVADVTERKRAEEALRVSEEAVLREQLAHAARLSKMGELVSSIAHELRQPLSAMLFNVEAAELFLNQAPPALDELRDILADIRKENERAVELIQSLRALMQKQDVEHEPLEINLLAEEVLRFVKEDAVSRRIQITTEFSPRLPAVLGNRVQLQQVFLNFITNAMDAMADLPPERRRLTVGTRLASDGGVEVAVSDLGSGIEPDDLPRLFQPFFTTKKSGLGIGLSVAEKIATAHNGRIWAENRQAGGAAFHLILPATNGA